MTSLNLGLIGNCQISSLIDDRGTMVWSCLPQFDSDPVFCRLLRNDNEAELPGFFEIELVDFQQPLAPVLEVNPFQPHLAGQDFAEVVGICIHGEHGDLIGSLGQGGGPG